MVGQFELEVASSQSLAPANQQRDTPDPKHPEQILDDTINHSSQTRGENSVDMAIHARTC